MAHQARMPSRWARLRRGGAPAVRIIAILAVLPAAGPPPPDGPVFTFARGGILGTSLDLKVVAPSGEAAARFERAVLEETDRLSGVFSTYDPRSEISGLNARAGAAPEAVPVSEDLGRLLAAALAWWDRSGGAFHPCAGELFDLWRRGREPSDGELAGVLRERMPGARPTCEEGPAGAHVLRWDGRGRFHLDAIAKGCILDRAGAAARRAVPEARGFLLDIGGDILTWGDAGPDGGAWTVGVADPRRSEDNAPPLARLRLRGQAVATSGGYARRYTAGGRAHSHILDPRTGRPAEEVLGATVVAPTAEAADAMATALCVLGPREGLALVSRTEGAAALVVDRDGRAHRSPSWAGLEQEAEPPAPVQPPRAGPAWPSGHEVRISFTLLNSWERNPPKGKKEKFNRHYTAAWVEDAQGRVVKLLALWANRKELDHLGKLNNFWDRFGRPKDARQKLAPVTRATRPPGKYNLVWDGRDEQGQPAAPGRYTVHLDVNREKGPPNGREVHTHVSGEILCGDRPARVRVPDQPELGEVDILFGPRPPAGAPGSP